MDGADHLKHLYTGLFPKGWAELKFHPEILFKECADSTNVGAAAAFLQRYESLIRSVINRMLTGANAGLADADDLVQETLFKLFRNKCGVLDKFVLQISHGDFGYIRKTAVSVVLDYFKRNSKTPLPLDETLALSAETPSAEDQILQRQLDDALFEATKGKRNCERDRRIFQLHYRVGLTAKQIADLRSIGLTTKGVESALRQMVSLIQERLQINIQRHLQIKPNSAKTEDAASATLQEQA